MNNKKKIDPKLMTKEQRHEYATDVVMHQADIDWNAVNYKRECLYMAMCDIDEYVEFKRPVPEYKNNRCYNYRSWIEYYLFECGILTMAEYEPIKIKYERSTKYGVGIDGSIIETHNKRISYYSPDTVSNANDNICFEIKGHLTTIDDDRGQKYIDIKKQTGKQIVFVLQKENILLPWTVENGEVLMNGGTGDDLVGQTMEQWCEENGFYYTYYYDLRNFLCSKVYRNLLLTA